MEGASENTAVQAPKPPWIQKWRRRHQHPLNYALHVIGIPMTMLALFPLLWDIFSLEMWAWASGMFLGGFAIQFLGHAIEGNDPGEIILLKKKIGKPYVAVSPRWASPSPSH